MASYVESFGRAAAEAEAKGEPAGEAETGSEKPVRPQMPVTVIPVLADGVLEEIGDQVFETVKAAALRALTEAYTEHGSAVAGQF